MTLDSPENGYSDPLSTLLSSLRIVLTNIGTFGDVNPLIAIALEMRRRGHHPLLAVPELYRPKIEPLGIEFTPVRPDIHPEDSRMAAMVYDLKKGTERGLREFLFPALRQSYDDLLAAVHADGGADLLLAGELAYAGPIVAEVTGIPWASYVLAPLSFFSGYDPPVLPPYPMLAQVEPYIPGMGHGISRFARIVTRNWVEPVYALRAELGLAQGTNPLFDAKHSPDLVLALFSNLLGSPKPDWPPNTMTTGFVFYDGDAGKQELVPELESFLRSGDAPIVFTLGSAAVHNAGDFFEQSAQAAALLGKRAVLLVGSGSAQYPKISFAFAGLRGSVRSLLPLVSPGLPRRSPGRRGNHGSGSSRGCPDARHALQPRSAGQRTAGEEAGSCRGHPAEELHRRTGSPDDREDVRRFELPARGSHDSKCHGERKRAQTGL